MAYSVYAVKTPLDCEKERFFIATYDNLEQAKHMANCATLGDADYAYVKDSTGGTVFYLEAIRPDVIYGANTIPIERCRPVDPE